MSPCLRMPPQSNSNVIMSINPHLGLRIPTSNVPLRRSAVSPELGFTALANIPAASYRACMLPISAAPLCLPGLAMEESLGNGALSDARLSAQLVTIQGRSLPSRHIISLR